jgi:uncharacterized protein YbjT (DUF2867 family)
MPQIRADGEIRPGFPGAPYDFLACPILGDPALPIGQIYDLTGYESADLNHYARASSEALDRTIRYHDVPVSEWSEKLLATGVPAHVASEVPGAHRRNSDKL